MNLQQLLIQAKAIYKEMHEADKEIRNNKLEAPMLLKFKKMLQDYLIMNRINLSTLEKYSKVAYVAKPKKEEAAVEPAKEDEKPTPPSTLLADNSEKGKAKRRTRARARY